MHVHMGNALVTSLGIFSVGIQSVLGNVVGMFVYSGYHV